MPTRTGGCLCGSVTYSTDDPNQDVLQCHCENCRRLSGNFVAAVRVDTDGLEIADTGDNLDWYDLDYAWYGFCRRCGATLFYRAADHPEITSVMVGTFDDTKGMSIAGVWFASDAQPHNTLPEGVPHHAGNG